MLDAGPALWGAAPGRTDPPAAVPSGTLLERAFCDPSAVSACPAARVDASASVVHVSAGSSSGSSKMKAVPLFTCCSEDALLGGDGDLPAPGSPTFSAEDIVYLKTRVFLVLL